MDIVSNVGYLLSLYMIFTFGNFMRLSNKNKKKKVLLGARVHSTFENALHPVAYTTAKNLAFADDDVCVLI